MRILWLSHLVPYPPKGGVQQRSYNLIRELSRHHEVIVLPFFQRAHHADNESIREARDHFSKFCTFLPPVAIPSESRVLGRHRLALRSLVGDPYTIQWLKGNQYAAELASAMRKFSPQALHFDTISLAPFRAMTRGTPAVLNHHNIESDMLLRRASLESNAAKRIYYWQEGVRLRRYEINVATQFAAHLTCSSLDSQRLQASVPDSIRTEVIPNGVDLEFFKPSGKHSPEPNSIVFAGRLSWYPNAMAMRFFVKDIWPALRDLVPNTKVTVIGRSPPMELLDAARSDSRITVTGFVDDVRPYMEKSMVYFCPIFDGGGTKLKILDALAMSSAIVAHPIACEGIEVTEGKDVLFASTGEQFATGIKRLFEDSTLRERLSANARTLAQSTYSFVEIGAKLARCFESLQDS